MWKLVVRSADLVQKLSWVHNYKCVRVYMCVLLYWGGGFRGCEGCLFDIGLDVNGKNISFSNRSIVRIVSFAAQYSNAFTTTTMDLSFGYSASGVVS